MKKIRRNTYTKDIFYLIVIVDNLPQNASRQKIRTNLRYKHLQHARIVFIQIRRFQNCRTHPIDKHLT